MFLRLRLNTDDLISIADHLDVALWVIDIPNQAAFFSKGFETIFGKPAEEFYQNPDLWIKFLYPDDLPIAKRIWLLAKGEMSLLSLSTMYLK